MRKIALVVALLPLAACDALQQGTEDQIRNEISQRVDVAKKEIRSQTDEHLNTVAPELSVRIDDVPNRLEAEQQRHEKSQNQVAQLE